MEMEQGQAEPKIRRLAVTDEVCVELTKRVASGGSVHGYQRNTWSEYALILALATKIIDQAPQSTKEIDMMDIEQRTSEAVSAIAEALHAILPGGIMEIVSYLPEEMRQKRWGSGVNW